MPHRVMFVQLKAGYQTDQGPLLDLPRAPFLAEAPLPGREHG